MKRLSSLIAFFLVFFLNANGNSQAPSFDWAHVFTGEEINAIATNPLNGDVYAAGHFANTVDFDPGPSTFNLATGGNFIGKYDTDGNLIWAKKSGGSNVKKILFNHLDESLYITGNYQGTADFDPGTGVFNLTATNEPGNFFLLKLNSDGEFVWARAFTLSIVAMKTDPNNGDIFLTGSFPDAADADPGTDNYPLYSNGYGDIYIMKLDRDGNFQWVKTLGGTYIDMGSSIDIDQTNGDILVAGLFTSTVDFNPDPVEEFKMSGPSQWGYAFILKLDGSGNFKWAKSFGGSGSFINLNLQLDHTDENKIYFAASFHGNVEVDPDPINAHPLSSIGWAGIILELDSTANLNWVKVLKSDYEVFVNSMVVIPQTDGGIYLGGDFGGRADFDPGPDIFNLVSAGGYFGEIFVARYDLSGNFIWAKSVIGKKHDYGESIALDSSGNVYVGGYFTSDTITFDNTSFLNSNQGQQFSYDMFIAKIGTSTVSVPKEINADQILLYPNPVTDELIIEIDSVEISQTIITIFNDIGNIAFAPVVVNDIHQASININQLIPGIYFIQIQSGSKVFIKKFLKI